MLICMYIILDRKQRVRLGSVFTFLGGEDEMITFSLLSVILSIQFLDQILTHSAAHAFTSTSANSPSPYSSA